jgi:uncharacterized membrane protein (UPF0127 family)
MRFSRESLRNLILEEMDRALPRCQRGQVSVDSIPISVEVADSDFLRNRGLMFRESMSEDEGMLFIFPEADQRGFWMKNTHIPLSIAFLDDRGVILNIADMTPHDLRTTYSEGPARCALEMNQGWFERNGIVPGSHVLMS